MYPWGSDPPKFIGFVWARDKKDKRRRIKQSNEESPTKIQNIIWFSSDDNKQGSISEDDVRRMLGEYETVQLENNIIIIFQEKPSCLESINKEIPNRGVGETMMQGGKDVNIIMMGYNKCIVDRLWIINNIVLLYNAVRRRIRQTKGGGDDPQIPSR